MYDIVSFAHDFGVALTEEAMTDDTLEVVDEKHFPLARLPCDPGSSVIPVTTTRQSLYDVMRAAVLRGISLFMHCI